MFQIVTIPSRESAEVILARMHACTQAKKVFHWPLNFSNSLFEGDFWKMSFQLRHRSLFANRYFFASVEGEIRPNSNGCVVTYQIALPFLVIVFMLFWTLLLFGIWTFTRLKEVIREGIHWSEFFFLIGMASTPWLLLYWKLKYEFTIYRNSLMAILQDSDESQKSIL